MYIHKETKKRINHYAPVTIGDISYPHYPLELLEEIPDPVPPIDYTEDTYYRNETDDAPYVIYTRKSDEQITAAHNAKIDAQIAALELQYLLPRMARDFFRMTALQAAENIGVSEADLLDPDSPHCSPGFIKLYQLDQQITELRRSRK